MKLAATFLTGVIVASVAFDYVSNGEQSTVTRVLGLFHKESTPDAMLSVHWQDLNELATTEFVMETLVPVSETNQFAGFELGKTTNFYIGRVVVKAGLDLSKVQHDTTALGRRVTTPAPVILSATLDPKHSRTMQVTKEGFIAPEESTALSDSAQQKAVQKVLEAACQNGILDKVNRRLPALLAPYIGDASLNTTAPGTCQPKN